MEALQVEANQGDGDRVRVQSFLTSSDGGRRSTFICAQNAGGSSVLSAIANTTNTILGSGTLAIPAAMKCSGVLAYELVMCGVFVATCVSMRWLIAVAEALPTEQPRNYESIARVYLGNGAATAITGAFIFGGMALNVSYIIMIGACLSPIAISILDLSGGDGNQAQAELFIRWGVGLLIVLPLSCLRDISKLKVTSSIAIVTLSYAALYVVKQGEVHIKANGISPTFSWYFLSSNIFTCMAMTVSAFSCHISAMPIYESLGQRRSPRTMMTVVMVSLVLSAIVYHCVGLTGYMQFGADVKGNVLESVATINTDDEWMYAFGLPCMDRVLSILARRCCGGCRCVSAAATIATCGRAFGAFCGRVVFGNGCIVVGRADNRDADPESDDHHGDWRLCWRCFHCFHLSCCFLFGNSKEREASRYVAFQKCTAACDDRYWSDTWPHLFLPFHTERLLRDTANGDVRRLCSCIMHLNHEFNSEVSG
eukprot:TRINITY_DN20133_c0_g1_i6.p1 TRINITY_DN20133_c0_g1~~TRINITY_DN20133_c0_g1_i6.p1  ORF type:complete len:481 (-),score=45.24 TRINITY_DN20133_c0_g1_i6:174-1616(-)